MVKNYLSYYKWFKYIRTSSFEKIATIKKEEIEVYNTSFIATVKTLNKENINQVEISKKVKVYKKTLFYESRQIFCSKKLDFFCTFQNFSVPLHP